MNEQTPQPIAYQKQLSILADEHPDRDAIVFITGDGENDRTLTWRVLDDLSNQTARLLQQNGVDENSTVVIGLFNCPEHYIVTFAAWKLGALVLPLRAAMPERERNEILDLAKPAVVVSIWEDVSYTNLSIDDLSAAHKLSADPLPDMIANPGKSIASGGSTGRPKIIVTPGDWVATMGRTLLALQHIATGGKQLVAGPLYHNAPFLISHIGMFEGATLVLMDRFNADRVVTAIEDHKIEVAYFAPIMMDRISKLPDVSNRDFSSIKDIIHTAAPCPPWLKQFWIELVGGEAVKEVFGATELVGLTFIRGDEWLEHRGSVGRPLPFCVMKILDPTGTEAPTGEVGEIFMKRVDIEQSYFYIGSEPAKTSDDGFASVGDLGYVDEDGYLFIADRRVDLIITGGANVYPAQVEAALTEHSGVGDAAVIGIPDDAWGKRVHAVVEAADTSNPPTVAELDAHCRDRLTSYKVPKSYEFVDELPRDPAGKIRRSRMVTERESGTIENIVFVGR